MSKDKPFDCIAMKDEIQARLAKEWEGLTDDQIRDRIRHNLETSDDMLARWWRKMGTQKEEREAARACKQ